VTAASIANLQLSLDFNYRQHRFAALLCFILVRCVSLVILAGMIPERAHLSSSGAGGWELATSRDRYMGNGIWRRKQGDNEAMGYGKADTM